MPALSALWASTLADWAVSVPKQYWEGATPHPHLDFASLDPGRRCMFFARHEASSFSREEIKLCQELNIVGITTTPG